MSEPTPTPCSNEPDLFFSHSQRKIQRALNTCATCPLIEICREEALTNDERHGIWGGKTPAERYAICRSQTHKSKRENR